MRFTILMLALLFIGLPALAADTKVITKTSKQQFDIEKEVRAFYLRLVEKDPEVRNQFAALTEPQRAEYKEQFFAAEPRVIEMPPNEQGWNAGGLTDVSGHYLVLQRVGMARAKYSRYDDITCAEFEVSYKARFRPDPRRETEVIFISNTITITFLGFRKIALKPLPTSK